MWNTIIFILLILYQVNCINKNNEILMQIVNMDDEALKIGISKTYSIEYKNYKNFTFDINDNSIYQINIHSINCNFDIYSKLLFS